MGNENSLVLVTGGAGFIGSHLVRGLLGEGYRVRVLDDVSTGLRSNLDEVAGQIEMVEGSITDAAVTGAAMVDARYVLHQAAIPSVPRSVRDPVRSNEANVTGTLTLLTAARDAGVERLVYAASSSAYGDTPVLPKVEIMTPDPISPYAVSKLAAEQYCRSFTRVYGLQTVSLRYFNVFGPRQNPKSEYAAVVPRFITAMLNGEPVPVNGDGEQSRDFTYIENVVQANLKAMLAPQAAGDVCNIACGERYTLNQLIAILSEIMGIQPEVSYREGRAGDVKHSLADIDKARRLLGYEPAISFHEGLRRTVEYLRQQGTERSAA